MSHGYRTERWYNGMKRRIEEHTSKCTKRPLNHRRSERRRKNKAAKEARRANR